MACIEKPSTAASLARISASDFLSSSINFVILVCRDLLGSASPSPACLFNAIVTSCTARKCFTRLLVELPVTLDTLWHFLHVAFSPCFVKYSHTCETFWRLAIFNEDTQWKNAVTWTRYVIRCQLERWVTPASCAGKSRPPKQTVSCWPHATGGKSNETLNKNAKNSRFLISLFPGAGFPVSK